MKRLLRWYAVLSRALHRTLLSALAHDCLNVAQSTAYSAIVALFPALIVAAAVIGLLPDTAPVRFQLADFFDRVLPASVSLLLDAAFENAPKHAHSVRALVGAGMVSFAGASNVISTLMEGLRRARGLPRDCWSFWQRRRRSFELVPLSLVPLTIASLLVVFGHAVSLWLVSIIGPQARAPIYTATLLLRWAVAVGASVGLIALLYHMGVPAERVGPARQHSGHRSSEPLRRVYPQVVVVEDSAGGCAGHRTVVPRNPDLRLVRDPVHQLHGGVWASGRGHRASILALHHLAERTLRSGVQRPLQRPDRGPLRWQRPIPQDMKLSARASSAAGW